MKIGRLGNAGSDYSAFVQHVGIPSSNMIFGEGKALHIVNSRDFSHSNRAPWTLTGPGYPVYHSLYDDFVWMEKPILGSAGMLQVLLSILLVRFVGSGICCTALHDNQYCHLTAASIWGIMALRLADEEIIPFSYMSYTTELEVHCPLSATTFGGRGSQRNEDRSKTYELDISFFFRRTQK
jgi:N-acetylated-alpha-linked acidic dipeptidase